MEESYILECKDLVKEYEHHHNKLQVIKPTSFGIKEGSVNLILGKSGSGKTTLLSMLQGIEKPTSGNVYYRNIDFYQCSEEKQAQIRGNQFGIIFQSFHLISELSVMDNVKVPLIINGRTFDEAAYEKLLEILRLQEVQTMYPSQLSGGQQQRVAIARAMIMKPDILFADEPTGNLDSENGKNIAQLFDKINREYGTTIVVVTHDRELIEDPDRVFFIKDGEIRC